jgi:hypothetical protein
MKKCMRELQNLREEVETQMERISKVRDLV